MITGRHLAPAGAPIGSGDLMRAAALALSPGDLHERLRQQCCERFGVRRTYVTSTGRAGLTLLLKAMRRLRPERDEVILPSYTCYSVAASVVKAGLRVRIVDISTDTLDYAPDRLKAADFSRVIALVATNLYGLPNDLPALSQIARDQGVFLIDDAAQAMGASVGGRASGTWGDAGLFSLDKGKNVSAIDGGLVVTNSASVASALDEEMAHLPRAGRSTSVADIAKALAYFTFLRPSLYGIPRHLPGLGLGKTVFTTEFPLHLPSRPLAALALVTSNSLQGFTQARVSNAATLLDGVRLLEGVRTVTLVAGATPVYLRLPLLVADQSAKARVLGALDAAGIGATGSYPASIADVVELRDRLAPGPPDAACGRQVARAMVTLPTHPFVVGADIDRMVVALRGALHVSHVGVRDAQDRAGKGAICAE